MMSTADARIICTAIVCVTVLIIWFASRFGG
jgi:hypothetical protein